MLYSLHPTKKFQKWKCSCTRRGHDPYCLRGSTEPLGWGFCPLARLRNVPLALKPISKAALFADRVSGTNKHDDSTQSPTITERATQSPQAEREGEREMKEIPLPQSSYGFLSSEWLRGPDPAAGSKPAPSSPQPLSLSLAFFLSFSCQWADNSVKTHSIQTTIRVKMISLNLAPSGPFEKRTHF